MDFKFGVSFILVGKGGGGIDSFAVRILPWETDSWLSPYRGQNDDHGELLFKLTIKLADDNKYPRQNTRGPVWILNEILMVHYLRLIRETPNEWNGGMKFQSISPLA